MLGARWAALPGLTADGRLLFATSALRNVAYGFLSVVLGLYLAALGPPAPAIGGVFTAALAGGAVLTFLLATSADRWGRRRTLLLAAALMALAGTIFALTANLVVLVGAAFVGAISPSGKEVGPFLSIEQAILPQTAADRERTALFAAYNLVNALAGAVGALAAGVPAWLGLAAARGYHLLLWAYVGVAVLELLLFSRLSPKAELRPSATAPRRRLGLHRSLRIVVKLAGLFALDAFAGALVLQSLIAYWFQRRFGVDTAQLAAVFFGTNLCAAASFLAAAPIARRFGLLNTMVFSHLPSNVLLILVPLMPSFPLAAAMLLARSLLSQLDVPTRQSYTVAVVNPDERAAAAGVTSVARTAASAAAPVLAGAALAGPALALPFVLAGSLKVFYDLAIFAVFRGVRPPEER